MPKDGAFAKVTIEAGLPDLFQMDLQLAWQVVANHIIDYKPFNEISSIPTGEQLQVSSLGFRKLNFTRNGITTYRTRAIISRGLYIFYPKFHCGLYSKAAYITDSLCTKKW